MKSKRLKSQRQRVPDTPAEVAAYVAEAARLKAEEARLKAEMDARLHRVREQYQQQLAALAAQLRGYIEALHDWAEAHPEYFRRRRSLDFPSGVIGYRITPPAIRPVRGWTWAEVLARLRERGRRQYIRIREDVDREALLAARDTEDLAEYGLRIVQRDEFFVEPRMTRVETREEAAHAES